MNETESNPDANFWHHSVWRYWQNPKTKWIEKEYLFDTNAAHRVWYDQVDIFDDWAIATKGKTFYVLFFDDFRGKEMPQNYAVQVQKISNDDTVELDGYTFYWNNGEWQMRVLIRY